MEDLCRQVLTIHPEGRQIERAMLARGLNNLTRLAHYADVDSLTVQRFLTGAVDEGTQQVRASLGLGQSHAPLPKYRPVPLRHF